MFTNLLLGYTKGSGKEQTGKLHRGRMIFFTALLVGVAGCAFSLHFLYDVALMPILSQQICLSSHKRLSSALHGASGHLRFQEADC